MRFNTIISGLAIVLVAFASMTFTAGSANASTDVYTTEGYHISGGREWQTTCEPYSLTTRCRTNIKSGGEWVFNNLTYLPVPSEEWGNNPLANSGTFISNGRDWATVCNDEWTGPNACRTFIRNVDNHMWQFNSIVAFTPGSANHPKVSFNLLTDKFEYAPVSQP